MESALRSRIFLDFLLPHESQQEGEKVYFCRGVASKSRKDILFRVSHGFHKFFKDRLRQESLHFLR